MKCPRCGFDSPPDTRFCGRCAAPLALDGPAPTLTGTLAAPVRELETGTTFARRYQVIEELGHGGMGRVYKVFDTEVREKLALKLLRPEIATDAATIERFRNELRLARTVSHRNVCRMHDLGREEGSGTFFITMEYVPGEDLKSLLHSIGALPLGKAVTIARQAAEGLAEAHRLGVVHRDLKPQNIMIDREGAARIMDFGIARSVGARGLTGAGVMIGTPEYMSPEQVDGKEADARSDIYSLGVVLFEMLTGRLPFEGETPLSVAVKQKSEPPPDPRTTNAQIPDELAKLVLKCLEKDKGRRFASADGLGAELAAIEAALPATTGSLPLRKQQTSKQITVRLPAKKIWIPAAAVLVVLAALLVWQFVPESEGSKRTVAVLGFKNQTGDPGLDHLREIIPNLLITSLEQSKHMRVASWQRLRDLFRQAGKSEAALYDEEAGFEVCRRQGIDAVVVGFFSRAGETFVSDVKVLDVGTREVLKSASARGEGVNSILRSQVDEISRDVGRGIGKPLLKIEAPVRPVIELTTDSFEAYDLFLKGREAYEKFYYAESKACLDKAISLDPEFAIAYMVLAETENMLGDSGAREAAIRSAYRYSAAASEKERLLIAAWHAHVIEGDFDKELSLLLTLVQKFPDEKYAHHQLGFLYEGRGKHEAAIPEYEKSIALDPNFGWSINQLAYIYARAGKYADALRLFERYAAIDPADANPVDSIAELYVRMGNLDLAEAKYRQAMEMKPDFFSTCGSLSYVAMLREDYGEAERWIGEFVRRAPTPPARALGEGLGAFMDYLLGRWENSLARYARLRQQAEAAAGDDSVAFFDWITAFIHRDRGEIGAAEEGYARFFDRRTRAGGGPTPIVEVDRAFFKGWVDLVAGRSGDASRRVEEIGPLLSRVDPVDAAQAKFLRDLLRAETALAANDVARAVSVGREIVPLDFPNMGYFVIPIYNQPFVKDVLARALWKKGDLDGAVAEYRKLTTIDPSNQVRWLISPLYHYRLGRVLEEKGDKTGAAVEYRKFLDYWKDADLTHPELADARNRLAAL